MGAEFVFFKDTYFIENNQIVSEVQKFMELYLSQFEHPKWFVDEVLEDLKSNFHMPHGKFFFDESVIRAEVGRLEYAILMIDQTIEKMESLSKKEFSLYIKDAMVASWIHLDNPSYYNNEIYLDNASLNENEIYHDYYIGTLKRMKKLLEEYSLK